MNLLLDTHALLWWLAEPDRLGSAARQAIADARTAVYVSAASAWEIAIKSALRKLSVPPDLRTWFPEALRANRFTSLPITVEHALGVERIPRLHADPFDRLLIAQAMAEGLTIVTGDPQLEGCDVPVIRC